MKTKVIALLLAIVLALSLLSGCGKTKQNEAEPASPMADVQAIAEYAEMLEAEGNKEAAAQVWSMIPEAAEESAREEMCNEAKSNNQLQALESVNKANELVNSVKGGKK